MPRAIHLLFALAIAANDLLCPNALPAVPVGPTK